MAFRILGSVADAEDAVQEAWLRLSRSETDDIENLGGWLTSGAPEPDLAAVSELWHLLYDDPVAGRALASEEIGEAYDDLVEEVDGWFATHGELSRRALIDAVGRLKQATRPG